MFLLILPLVQLVFQLQLLQQEVAHLQWMSLQQVFLLLLLPLLQQLLHPQLLLMTLPL